MRIKKGIYAYNSTETKTHTEYEKKDKKHNMFSVQKE